MANRHRWTIVSLGVAAAVFGAAVASAADPPAQPKEKMGSGPRPSERAVLSEKTVLHADLAYGKDAKQRLNVYAPAARQMRRSSFSSTAANGAKATRAKSATSPSFSTNRASSSSPPTTASRRR